MKRQLLSIFSALLLVVPGARAITLGECRALAASNYPLIRQTALVERTAALTVERLGAAFLPQVEVNGQATLQSEVAALPDMLRQLLRQNGLDYRGLGHGQYRVGVDVSQLVYDGGQQRERRAQALRQGEVEAARTAVDLYAVRSRVDELYFGLLLLDERLRLNEALQALLRSSESRLEALCRGGVATEADVAAVKAERLRAGQQRAELATTRESLQTVLALFIGRDPSVLRDLERPEADLPTADAPLRPELRLFDAQQREAVGQRRLLAATWRPSVGLFAQGWYGYPGLNMFDDMYSRTPSLCGVVGLRFRWNVSSLYTRRTDLRRIDNTLELIDNARRVFLFNNRLQAASDSGAVEGVRRQLAADDEIVRLRQTVREAAESRLDGGTIDTNALVQELYREHEARVARCVHEITLLQNIHCLKTTLNR